ncbi:hypothetical protein B2M27_15565 (plasmid) [Kluyvera intermedia]|uniref:Uncharacterized protein n=1 Tax=Kluyvera intermedia TaxID=61648 RepID=A0ABX3UD40_KLUIN|nr:hypothetical protein B2M27_15565 [Kluyvera intermedia]
MVEPRQIELCIKARRKTPLAQILIRGNLPARKFYRMAQRERRDALPQCWRPATPQAQHIALSTEMVDKSGDSVELAFCRMARKRMDSPTFIYIIG